MLLAFLVERGVGVGTFTMYVLLLSKLGESRELYLLLFNCLQLKITLILKWHFGVAYSTAL